MKNLITLFLCALYGVAYSQTVYPSGVTGCIARWDFSGTGAFTSLADVSGNGNNGSVNNINATVGWLGNQGSAGDLNGINSGALVSNNAMLTPSQLTIVALVKVDSFYSGYCELTQILCKGYPQQISGCYGMGFNDNIYDQACGIFSPNNQQLTSQMSTAVQAMSPGNYIQPGKWYFVAVTYDGNTAKNYQLEMSSAQHVTSITPYFSQTNLNASLGSSSQDISIGYHLNPSYPYWFNGSMDEVALFNKVLTDNEVFSIYDYLWQNVYINQPFIDTLKYPGASLNVNYTVPSSVKFNSGNTFSVQLSDAGGSFSSPTSIGSVSAIGSGTIPCIIPAATAIGTGYRIRIIASSPAFTSLDNGKDIRVVPTGIANVNSDNISVQLFPNPATDNFTLQAVLANDDIVHVDITNGVGQVVYRTNVTPVNNTIHQQITLNAPNGIYYVHLRNDYMNKIERITISK